jgi:hypothetical protein
MNKKDLWLLFKNTGKIEYYLKYKELDNKNDKKNRRNSY